MEGSDEIVALADRIVVMFEGRFVDEFSAADVSIDTLGLRMGGSFSAGDSSCRRGC